MKYWGYLLAKIAAAAGVIWAAWFTVSLCFPRQAVFLDQELDPFTHDLGYTAAMMLFIPFCGGLVYWIAWDQRYRCRTCARRLRMPLIRGSWDQMLLVGPPRIEYICLYGHGTLREDELRISGMSMAEWEPHSDNIWTELCASSKEAGDPK